MMKKFVLLTVLMILSLASHAQITFQFSDGIDDTYLKDKVEGNISTLLTEINNAADAKRELNLNDVTMTQEARKGLESRWNSIHFRCLVVKRVVQPCLEDATGFEVRQIPVEVQPLNKAYKGELSRELTISFDKNGSITGVSFALDNNSYMKIMDEGENITEERQLREISKFVEDFGSYYVEKNLSAIEQIFSDDALIITGRVIKTVEPSRIEGKTTHIREKIIYNKQDKKTYIKNLEALFKNNKYLNVDFQDIEVVRHSTKPGFYGVRLRQKWSSQNRQNKKYADDGYLFLLWDFTDETNPKIHVRQWTPNTTSLKQEDMLTPDSFEIY